MAEHTKSVLTTAKGDSDSSMGGLYVDISDWTNKKDREERSRIIDTILYNSKTSHKRSMGQLRTIVNGGWDVNERLFLFDFVGEKKIVKTALNMAVGRGCTEAVKILLNAGAQCKTSNLLQNPLIAAIENGSTDIIKILLKHGVDPNDHDDQFENVPLLKAMVKSSANAEETVRLLMQHGAGLNTALYVALVSRHTYRTSAAMFKTLIDLGADVNHKGTQQLLLHRLITRYTDHRDNFDLLDFFFQHGGNISVGNIEGETALCYAVRTDVHTNTIRWLIRHGADMSVMYRAPYNTRFREGFVQKYFPEVILLLLRSGMRMTFATQQHLLNMEMTQEDDDILKAIEDMRPYLPKNEEEELQNLQSSVQKSTFSEYFIKQMADLGEFSDHSLLVYPVDHCYEWEAYMKQIQGILEFISQPQSLQWYSRRCVQENLVSLQPSVVKTLHVPAILKRYLLCHEL